jgi:hypothetical protein
MKFESSFLVRVTQLTRFDWICLSPTTSLRVLAPTKKKAMEIMRDKLENYVNICGVNYINSIGRSPDGVCCPEGFLDLPADVWKCKLDKRVCMLQAWISTNNKEQFLSSCHAPDQRKEGIFRTITEGIYIGAHHRPGRYLCPNCRGKANTRYHYSWELTPLSDFVATNDQGFRAALIENGINMAVISSNLCPDCFVRVISIIKPSLLCELESIRLSFMNEPSGPRKPEGSLLKDEEPSCDFVSYLLKSPDSSWYLGLALASLFSQEEPPDFGDALELAGDWLGLTDEDVTNICNDEDESRYEGLRMTADSVAWRVGWMVICGGFQKLRKRGWNPPE